MKNYIILSFVFLILLNSASASTYGSVSVENSTRLYGESCTGTTNCTSAICLLETGTCGCSLDNNCYNASTPYCCQGVCKADCSTGEPAATTTIIEKSSGTSKGTVSSLIEAALNQMMEEARDLILSSPLIIEIYPGGYEQSEISIRNVFDKSILITAKVEGEITDFVTFENPFFTLEIGEEKDLKLRINTEKNAEPGLYSGNIEINAGDFKTNFPVKVKVLSPEDKLLDVKVEPLRETVKAGDKIPLQIDIYNLGQSKKVDVQLNIQLLTVDLDEVIKETEESLAVQTSVSILRTIKIPAYLNGKYVVKVIAHYTNEDIDMVASSISTINVKGDGLLTGAAIIDLIASKKFPWVLLILVLIIGGFFAYKKGFIKRPHMTPKTEKLGKLEVYDEPQSVIKEQKSKDKIDEKVDKYKQSLKKRR